MDKINIENHISVHSTDMVLEVSRRFLQRYDLTHFSYARSYKDNSCFTLSTHPGMSIDFLKNEFYNVTDYEKDFSQVDSAFLLWICANKKEQKLINYTKENYNYHNGIIMINNKGDYQEQFYFATDPSNYSANNFYINNIDLLEQFNKTFLDKAEHVIADCHKQRVYIPERDEIGSDDKYRHAHSYLNEYMSEVGELSRREIQVLHCMKDRFSCQKIAEQLGVKVKTVYFYIDNIKKKLGLVKKDELVKYYMHNMTKAMSE